MPFARVVAASDALTERIAVSAIAKPASSPSRPRRAPMTNPKTPTTLAQFCSSDVKKALLGALRRNCRVRLERLAELRPSYEAARSRRAAGLAVLDEDVAAQEQGRGGADHLGSLVEAVVAFGVVRGGGDGLPPLGVEDDEIGVGPDCDRPLARIKAE